MKRPLILLGLLLVAALVAGAVTILIPRSESEASDPVIAAPVAVMAPPLDVLDDEPPRMQPVIKPSPSPAPVAQDNFLKVGSRGAAVLALEQRLSDLKYLVGKVDDSFDNNTRHGLIAFQKVEGLNRSGVGDDATMARLATASTPAPAYATPADHLEVDIPRQTIYVVRGGVVSAIISTSTGTNKNFTSQGWTRRAVTPNGQFKIQRKINGMRRAPLGDLYKPSYFNGGIAFHGAPSVPTYPASHGCARVPMGFADWFYDQAPVGQVVYVHGGPTGSNPLPTVEADQAPEESPVEPQAPSTPEPEPEPSRSPEPAPPVPPSPDAPPSDASDPVVSPTPPVVPGNIFVP